MFHLTLLDLSHRNAQEFSSDDSWPSYANSTSFLYGDEALAIETFVGNTCRVI